MLIIFFFSYFASYERDVYEKRKKILVSEDLKIFGQISLKG